MADDFFTKSVKRYYSDSVPSPEYLAVVGETSWDEQTNLALSQGVLWMAQAAGNNLAKLYEVAVSYTASPIERAFLFALATVAFNEDCGVFLRYDDVIQGLRSTDPAELTITPQLTIGKYHVDFFLEYVAEWPHSEPDGTIKQRRESSALVVECDGHDFHEKTKDQAKRDKSRDRELAKRGFEVFHYTGSEIWADVFKCAEEVMYHLQGTAFINAE